MIFASSRLPVKPRECEHIEWQKDYSAWLKKMRLAGYSTIFNYGSECQCFVWAHTTYAVSEQYPLIIEGYFADNAQILFAADDFFAACRILPKLLAATRPLGDEPA